MKKFEKIYRYLLYILPLMLCFSYFPVISLGGNETMNFELSLPLIWLVVFDVFSFVLMCVKKGRKLFDEILGSVGLWLFPFFVTISVLWSPNPLRGVLTAGVMWALVFAVVEFYQLRDLLDAKFWKIWWRWFFGSALLACGWCVVQCILDLSGCSQAVTLLCDGCVYQMFGFPHPNGWAIEPQFMGNLLLAPMLCAAAILVVYDRDNIFRARSRARPSLRGARSFYLGRNLRRSLKMSSPIVLRILFFVFSATLFLTFSRGAIYAGVVGLLFLSGFVIFRARKSERRQQARKILTTWAVFAVAFVFTLNLQGIMAASSPTSDTYRDGVAKVLNHLSLGIIDIREAKTGVAEESTAPQSADKPVENSVENSEITEAVFDGYVAESTDTRVRLTSAAIAIWKQDFKTALFGVGLGGAGQALYDNDLSPAPKEIVQNEYASLLLETGLVGVMLFVLLIVLVIRRFLQTSSAGMLLSLLVAYGVTLIFFSGLPNAMQIVLLPGMIWLYLPKIGKTE